MVIAQVAFPKIEITAEHCAVTLAVCDIYLNPDSKGIICNEKRIKNQMRKYIVRSY